jgi:cysteine desulfurase
LLYFDHNATTFVAPEVAAVMAAAALDVYGNPSSVHASGQLARQHLERSRRTIAEFLNASPAEFVFTSGGTESNNLAILGLVRNLPRNSSAGEKHVITTAIEHPAVLETCRQLERESVNVSYVGVGATGVIDPDEIERNLRPSTVLISVMHANNEIGTIQPVAELAALVRRRRESGQRIYLHSDGVQAVGKIDVDLEQLGVDLYSLSAHKIFGPKGIGGLFVRKRTPIGSILYGGRHERERRPGTENVPGAMAFARAIELCAAHTTNVIDLRNRFEDEILRELPNVERNGAPYSRLPNTSNLLFRDVSGEAMVIALDMRGIAASTGSACSSGSIEPSATLLAIGRTREEARLSVRFSFGRYDTLEDVKTLIEAVIASARQIRKSSRQENRLVGV